MDAKEWPVAPWEELRDERTQGVVLLDRHTADEKTTAERCGDGWRIVEWELIHDFDETGMCWFSRAWHTVPDRYITALARIAP